MNRHNILLCEGNDRIFQRPPVGEERRWKMSMISGNFLKILHDDLKEAYFNPKPMKKEYIYFDDIEIGYIDEFGDAVFYSDRVKFIDEK
jgi:hypothetical protein